MAVTDATTTSTDGKQTYIRNISSKDTAVYYEMGKKSREELDKIAFFQNYSGTLVHDHETALYGYGTEHAHIAFTGDTPGTEKIDRRWKRQFSRGAKTGLPRKVWTYSGNGRKENNQAENRYARKEEKALLNRLKNMKKIAGRFRKESGKKMYCLILSIVETLKHRNRNLMEGIKQVFTVTPVFLAGVKKVLV